MARSTRAIALASFLLSGFAALKADGLDVVENTGIPVNYVVVGGCPGFVTEAQPCNDTLSFTTPDGNFSITAVTSGINSRGLWPTTTETITITDIAGVSGVIEAAVDQDFQTTAAINSGDVTTSTYGECGSSGSNFASEFSVNGAGFVDDPTAICPISGYAASHQFWASWTPASTTVQTLIETIVDFDPAPPSEATISYTMTVTPEPGTCGLLAVATGLALLKRINKHGSRRNAELSSALNRYGTATGSTAPSVTLPPCVRST